MFFAGALGAFAGAARQVAHLVGVVVAYLCAAPLGHWLGPGVAAMFRIPISVATLGTTLASFVVIWLVIRVALTKVLRRTLAGKDPEDLGRDRAFGFCLGALKAGAIAYVILCAIAFAEDNASVGGHRFGFVPRDSIAFALCRRHNVINLLPAPAKARTERE